MKRPVYKNKYEAGYALLSLLVAMTIGLVILVSIAAKPSAQFVGQRENEEEMFYRAQQVAIAIQTYATLRGGLAAQNLPTKLEDLTKEFNIQGRELHIVRKSAMTDPLTGEDWKAIRLGDPVVKEFARTYMAYQAEQQAQLMASGGPGIAQQGQQGMPPLLMWAAQAAGFNIANPNAGSDDEDENKQPSGFSLDMDSDSRPIVGVMSKSKKPLIRNYFGVESYDKAVFVAGIQVPASINVIPLGGGIVGAPSNQSPGDGQGTPAKITAGKCPPGSPDPTCARNQGGNLPPQ